MPVEWLMERGRIRSDWPRPVLLKGLPVNSVFAKQPLKTAALLSGRFSGMCHIPPEGHQGLDEIGSLGIHAGRVLHGAKRAVQRGGLRCVDGTLNVLRPNGGGRAHHDGALQRAFQFPHIPRPDMREQLLDGRFGQQARALTIGPSKTFQESPGQQGNVFCPIT